MDKKEMFDAFDDFSQKLLETLAETDAIKNKIQEISEENAMLRLENNKLRELLSDFDKGDQDKKPKQGRENLENIYEDGFHICTFFYGQRRENSEDCAFCIELLYRGED